MATDEATDILRQSSLTRENLSLLSLMEALAAGERVTQRDLARILLGLVDGGCPEVVGVLDETYEGHVFHGVPVVRGEGLGELVWDGVLITSLDGFEEAEERLQALGVKADAIWQLS